MIEALAAIGGIGTVGLAAAIVVMAFKLVAASREQLAVRDLLDEEREQHRKTRGELEVESAAHVVTRDELRKEKNLRASAESQRNQAHMEEREHVVRIIEKSNIADAAHLVARILAAPLTSGMPAQLPTANRSEDDRDGLVDPFAVQPSTSP